MCKPFDDFMAYNFDTIIQDLNEEQLQSILHSFECSNAEKIFSKIVLRGNEGVHEYFRKLSEQVSSSVAISISFNKSKVILRRIL